ncbi:MAG: DUF3494 domain-containing protein [Mariniphaga sp.]|nr:DUF3494 domain-containing protein [Mariniphaga sp.]
MRQRLATFILISVVFMSGCKKDEYLAKVGICPLVVSTIPADKAVGIPLNQVISVTFNEVMNPATFTSESLTITGSAVVAGVKAATVVTGVFTFNDKTVIFTPTSPLAANTLFTGTVKNTVKDMDGNALQVNYVWSFTTGVPPTVTSTDPANAAISVVLNKVVTATFSVPMNPLTITASTFTVKQGTTPVLGTVTYAGSTVSFTPAVPFSANTVYTGTIMTGANNVTGIPLATDYVWTFSTGTSPTVISTDPINAATGISLTKAVSATFSVPMDPLTVSKTTFSLKMGTSAIAGAVTYSGSTAVFTPTISFIPNTVYTATITSAVKNVAGLPLVNDYVWSFTTGIAPTVTATDPISNAIGVILTKTVTANFSVAMDPLTLSTTTFTLKQGTTPVVGAVTYSGTTASFNPTLIALMPNTVYTATITTGAKNVAGIGLAIDHVWSFTTEALVAPTVILTDPLDNATNVITGKTVTANFSMAMDQSTLTATTFTLKQGTTSVAGAVSYAGIMASFNPTVDLLPNTLYTATITTGAKSLGGAPLAANKVWSFTTSASTVPEVVSTDPLNLAIDVPLNKVIGATFNVTMDPLTITTTSFTVKAGAVSVLGVVSYIGKTANFTPSANLLPNTLYTATITTGAKNLTGVSIASNYVWTFTTHANLVVAPVIDLKSAGRFGILSGVGISNNAGFSVINNQDVGIYPGSRSSVTGFPPATIVGGAIYAADDLVPAGTPAMLNQAKLDLVAAYLFAEGATTPAPATVSGDQGGLTLAPGIYKSTSTLLIQNGNLTLDGQGDPNATWIFQIASAFTTVGGAGGSIILTGGAQAKNIFWQTGSSAVIGDYTTFYGNVLALQSITMNSYAVATGRMLAQNGAVVMTGTNTINKP